MSYKRLFTRFLSASPDRVHFAAHSHHFWPDVTLDAQQRAWIDAATLADQKWEKIFGEVIPRAQAHVARVLRLPDPATIVFAPNTHELLVRILSSLPLGRPHRVLTSDGEFHSFTRQMARLEEEGLALVTRVPCRPFETFAARWATAARTTDFDLAYVSHVFFDSGFANELEPLVRSIQQAGTVIVIDGYHGFCALPTDLSRIAERTVYLSGGYKYAMSGEGACFAHVPSGWIERPRMTGWFAAFGALRNPHAGSVPYAPGGARLMGATFDPVGLYRFNDVMDLLVAEKLNVESIHGHVHRLQVRFVREIAMRKTPLVESALLVPLSEPNRGHFLTYALANAHDLHTRLLAHNVVTDVRGDRLRFGFGLYHDDDDIVLGADRIARALE